MKILSIHVFGLASSSPVILSSAFELSFVSIFQRGTLKEFLNFNSRLIIGKALPDQHLAVELEEGKGVCYAVLTTDKIGVTMICDPEYPRRVAIDVLLRIIENFKGFMSENRININKYSVDTDLKYKYIETIIQDWQNPNEKDNILKLQSELNDVTDIMRKNLNELLKREENLESLMAKSKDLSASSVTFYKQAKKTNSCCNF